MKNRLLSLIGACILACGTPGDVAAASTTRIAVIYTDADDTTPGSFSGLLGGIDGLPGIEVIRLRLSEPDADMTRLVLAAANIGATLRLASAGGSIGPIAVLYPDIGEPYRSVFSKIIEGIEEKAQTRISSFAVGSNFNPQSISSELKRQDIRVVIALGRNGLKAASALDRDIGVVAGGVLSVQENDVRSGTILSLAPDPALLFARLKALSPKTQRVHVVYEPRQNTWLLKLAKEAARLQGIELLAQEASDLKAAAAVYQGIFSSADPRRDALWLPQDSTTVEESVVLPLVLQESWAKGMPVFSSNVSHVKRGVLFALYPNNVELGRHLASSALGLAGGSQAGKGVQPLREVLTAFNTRTASHLGLPRASMQQNFDLIFPEQ
ncbi:MAG: hypothetical protein L6Q55_14545 [Azonexus sp.]|nr:ABC transporter substrate binding protein [Azonexus sp.]MCK6413621.1 hypothetical protein [Azonexus sp.]